MCRSQNNAVDSQTAGITDFNPIRCLLSLSDHQGQTDVWHPCSVVDYITIRLRPKPVVTPKGFVLGVSPLLAVVTLEKPVEARENFRGNDILAAYDELYPTGEVDRLLVQGSSAKRNTFFPTSKEPLTIVRIYFYLQDDAGGTRLFRVAGEGMLKLAEAAR